MDVLYGDVNLHSSVPDRFGERMAKALAASKVCVADRELFCLSVRRGGEYFYLGPTERAGEAGQSLHLRFLHYPSHTDGLAPSLRQLLYHQVSHDKEDELNPCSLLHVITHPLQHIALLTLIVPKYNT